MDGKHKGLMYPSMKFQRAANNLETFTAVKKSDIFSQSTGFEYGNFSGAKAREFYENLLEESNKTNLKRNQSHGKSKDDSETTVKNLSKAKKVCIEKPNIKDKKQLSDTKQENLFLKMAQDGDIDGLRGIIKNNKVNINAIDQFGWTALMCAAKSGYKACVRVLLKEGADVNLQNSTGQTAKDIAKQSGIQDAFYAHRKSRRKQKSDVRSEFTPPVEQICDICRSKFFGSKHEHDTSTAHLFNCQYKSERTFYHIPEDNIGFKLMKQKGWDQEKGLGPEGTGRKFPVKTILKQDRQGLGSKRKEKAKITHFSARDSSAVESKKDGKMTRGSRVPRRTWKRKLIQKEEKEKKWEHNLRVYMNTE